jgi:hypothetical protein
MSDGSGAYVILLKLKTILFTWSGSERGLSVIRGLCKIIILYVKVWKSNLLLSLKTNQSPYSDASLHRNLICDSTFLLLHSVFRRFYARLSDKFKFIQGSDILNRITVWNNMKTILSVNINIEWSYEEGKFKS